MKKRALITGISGMVGSHLADYLIQNTDWEIFGLCRWRSPLDNVEHLLNLANRKKRLQFLYGDLTDYISLVHAVNQANPDYVFHLAAQSFPRTSFDSPINTFDTNINGTYNILEAIRQRKDLSPIVHVCSSSEVFGRVPKEKLPINEDCGFHPASPYAISKTATDLVGRFFAEAYGMNTQVTRMFTHTGPRRGDVFAESTFAKQIAMIEAGAMEPVIKTGNLDSLRTWADVRDAVKAYFMLVTINPKPGQCYNIGGTFTCTVRAMLDKLLEFSTVKGIAIQTDPDRLRPIDADLQVPDTTKFSRHTGWKPVYSFEQTMLDLLEYWRARLKRGRSFLSR